MEYVLYKWNETKWIFFYKSFRKTKDEMFMLPYGHFVFWKSLTTAGTIDPVTIDPKISHFMFTFKSHHVTDWKFYFQFLDPRWNTWSFEPHFSTDWTLKIFHMDFHGYSTPPSFIPSVLKSLYCVIESILDKS